MKTKIIPFDLETAKKIQAGEIEGKIKTIHKQDVRIVCWNRMDTETPIIALVQFNDWEGLFECNSIGEYMEGCGDDARLMHLVLEVPDNEPQFKPFDKVLVRMDGKDWTAAIYSHYDNKIKHNYHYVANGAHWEECILYAGNEHLVGTTNKPKEE